MPCSISRSRRTGPTRSASSASRARSGTAYSLPVKPLVPKPLPPDADDRRRRSSSKRRTCARAMRRRSPMSPSGPRPHGSRHGCRPPAYGPSTTSSTSPTTCCSSSGSRCTRSISRSSPGSEIRIRRATPGERITTLDGVDRALDPEMLVIADADKAQAVAGVMGGGLSEVSDAHEDHRARKRVFQSEERPAGRARSSGSRRKPRRGSSAGADVNAAVKGLERAIDAARGDWRGHGARRRHRRISRRRSTPRKLELRRARIAAHARPGDPRRRRRAHPQGPRVPDSPQRRAAGTSRCRHSASTCCAKSI